MEILDFITNGGIGTAIGGLFGIGQEWMRKHMEAKALAAEREHIVIMHKMQFEQDNKMAEFELLETDMQTQAEVMKGSYVHDASFQDVSPAVNNIRALVRPFCTVATGIAAYWRPDPFFGAFMLCLTWWFSGRRSQALNQRLSHGS